MRAARVEGGTVEADRVAQVFAADDLSGTKAWQADCRWPDDPSVGDQVDVPQLRRARDGEDAERERGQQSPVCVHNESVACRSGRRRPTGQEQGSAGTAGLSPSGAVEEWSVRPGEHEPVPADTAGPGADVGAVPPRNQIPVADRRGSGTWADAAILFENGGGSGQRLDLVVARDGQPSRARGSRRPVDRQQSA